MLIKDIDESRTTFNCFIVADYSSGYFYTDAIGMVDPMDSFYQEGDNAHDGQIRIHDLTSGMIGEWLPINTKSISVVFFKVESFYRLSILKNIEIMLKSINELLFRF